MIYPVRLLSAVFLAAALSAATVVLWEEVWAAEAGRSPGAAVVEDPLSISRLVAELQANESGSRWYAAYRLGCFGVKAGAGVEPLVKIVENRGEDEYVRGMAAWALGRIQGGREQVVPLLGRSLESKHVSLRRNASRSLGLYGSEARAAEPALVKLLEDEDLTTRVYAAQALWRISHHPQAVPFLVGLVRRGGAGAFEAAVALGELGAEAKEAIPVLVELLASPDEDLRRAAVRALARSGYPAVPPLLDALKHTQPGIRRLAARALGLSTAGKSAESALLQAVNDPDPGVREMAAWALARVRQ